MSAADAFLGVSNSLTGRSWRLRRPDGIAAAALEQLEEGFRRRGLDPLTARLLAGRGVNPEEAERVLAPRLRDQMPEPYALRDMERAVEALLDAAQAGRRICILADYDVDGATSGAMLLGFLRHIGAGADIFIPDRLRDGYGPSPAVVERLKAEGADLLVTLDCGASAHAALSHAARIGLPVIVFDHHLMGGQPPPALALVNPNQPGDNSGLGHLTAAGVVFLAVAALNRAARGRGLTGDRPDFDLMSRLDLAALGTICDVAPLTGINRVLVAQGLKVLAGRANPGIAALAESAGAKGTGDVYAAGWILGPRLNAGGRIGDSSLAVRLLSTADPEEARGLAADLERLNAERRAIEAGVLEEAVARVSAGEGGGPDAPLLMLARPGWHPGVAGIVAGRLRERFDRPVIVAGSADPDDPLAKGSGRSVPGVNLGRAVSDAARAGTLLAGGGHAMAAGLTVAFADFDRARDDLNARLAAETAALPPERWMDVDAVLAIPAADPDLMELVGRVGPYGAGWPEPVFALADVRPFAASAMKGGHMRVVLEDATGAKIRAVAFRSAATPLGDALRAGRPLHVAARVKVDTWRGGGAMQAEIIDASPAPRA